MPWQDRLRTLRYESPSGQAFSLNFDSLSRSNEKKAPVAEFPGQNQGAIQDLGQTTITLPISVYIFGPDYDTESDRLWSALQESGPGILDHPRWGSLNVLPVSVGQSEDFVEGAGRANFEIEFVRADLQRFEYPRAEVAADDRITADATAYETAVKAGLSGSEITDPRTTAGLKAQVLSSLQSVRDNIRDVTAGITEAVELVESAIADIERNIDSLVQAPADLIEAITRVYRLPARTLVNVQAKISGYRQIFSSLQSGLVSTTREYGGLVGLIQTGQASAIIVAAAEATTTGDLPTRGSAQRAIEALRALDADATAAVEEMEAAGDFRSIGREETARTLARSLQNVIDRAAALPTERTFILQESVPPIRLAYELYGDLDRLDQFIEYNDFAGNELLVIPRGREVRWYE